MQDFRQEEEQRQLLSRDCYQRTAVGRAPVRRGAPDCRRGWSASAARRGRGAWLGERGPLIALVGACIAVPLLLVAVFSLTTNGGAGMYGAAVPATGGWQPSDVQPDSTPKEMWKKGEVPYLFQIDPQWAEAPYAGSTVGEAGCGPTALTMAYIALTGAKDYDPSKMAQFSEDNGFLDGGLTTWTFMTEGAQKLGLKSKELPADAAQVARAVGEGHPVILTLGPGDFTSTGHFVVVAAIDDEGNWVISDPNSPERSSHSWSPQRVLGQCRNLWEISPGGWF